MHAVSHTHTTPPLPTHTHTKAPKPTSTCGQPSSPVPASSVWALTSPTSIPSGSSSMDARCCGSHRSCSRRAAPRMLPIRGTSSCGMTASMEEDPLKVWPWPSKTPWALWLLVTAPLLPNVAAPSDAPCLSPATVPAKYLQNTKIKNCTPLNGRLEGINAVPPPPPPPFLLLLLRELSFKSNFKVVNSVPPPPPPPNVVCLKVWGWWRKGPFWQLTEKGPFWWFTEGSTTERTQHSTMPDRYRTRNKGQTTYSKSTPGKQSKITAEEPTLPMVHPPFVETVFFFFISALIWCSHLSVGGETSLKTIPKKHTKTVLSLGISSWWKSRGYSGSELECPGTKVSGNWLTFIQLYNVYLNTHTHTISNASPNMKQIRYTQIFCGSGNFLTSALG